MEEYDHSAVAQLIWLLVAMETTTFAIEKILVSYYLRVFFKQETSIDQS